MFGNILYYTQLATVLHKCTDNPTFKCVWLDSLICHFHTVIVKVLRYSDDIKVLQVKFLQIHVSDCNWLARDDCITFCNAST